MSSSVSSRRSARASTRQQQAVAGLDALVVGEGESFVAIRVVVNLADVRVDVINSLGGEAEGRDREAAVGAHIWSMWRRRWSARQNTAMTVYWVSIYQEIRDEQKMAAYAALAGPALTSAGGRVIARDLPEKVYEGGLNQRVVIIEFDSLEAATAAYDSPAYREALAALGDGVRREIRIIPGV